ncbi:MAG: hypothetical protein WC609_00770 [Candidatus Paceibacterota bacterium]|jgi:hypothetical protein
MSDRNETNGIGTASRVSGLVAQCEEIARSRPEKKKEFMIADITAGELNALVKNIMSQTGDTDPKTAIRRVNSRGWIVVRSPRTPYEKDGVIYFSVTSCGMTGEEWVALFEDKHIVVDDKVNDRLLSEEFKPTSGITYKVAILNKKLLARMDQHIKDIQAEIKKRRFTRPNLEVACLIMTGYSFEDFGELRYHCGSINMQTKNSDEFLKLYGHDDDHCSMRVFRHGLDLGDLWASFSTSFAWISQVTKS